MRVFTKNFNKYTVRVIYREYYYYYHCTRPFQLLFHRVFKTLPGTKTRVRRRWNFQRFSSRRISPFPRRSHFPFKRPEPGQSDLLPGGDRRRDDAQRRVDNILRDFLLHIRGFSDCIHERFLVDGRNRGVRSAFRSDDNFRGREVE